MADEATPDPKDNTRKYHIFTTHELDLGDEKSVIELLKTAADEQGRLTVFARRATVLQASPKLALHALGQFKELDGDYEVIAENGINTYKDVKTKQEVTVLIGG